MYEILISPFGRFSLLKEFISSIRMKCDHKVRIAEDSGQYTSDEVSALRSLGNVEFYQMPTDVGIGCKRNFLVSQVETDYFLIVDEDHVVVHPEGFKPLLDAIQSSGATIVSGGVDGVCNNWVGYYTFGNSVELNFIERTKSNADLINGQVMYPARFVPNFFMADKAQFDLHRIQWDESLHLFDHIDFFLRFPQSLRIYHLEVTLIKEVEEPQMDERYRSARYERIDQYRRVFKEKYRYSEDPKYLYNRPIPESFPSTSPATSRLCTLI